MMDSLESGDEREKKMKLEEMSEGKSTRPSEDAMFFRREIIDTITKSDEKMKTYSKKAGGRVDKFLQTVNDSVGSQLNGINTTISKMKEECDDRYKQIHARIANMEMKISDTAEKCENRNDEPNRAQDDQNQGKAVVTGFHSETSESEVQQLLQETITRDRNVD